MWVSLCAGERRTRTRWGLEVLNAESNGKAEANLAEREGRWNERRCKWLMREQGENKKFKLKPFIRTGVHSLCQLSAVEPSLTSRDKRVTSRALILALFTSLHFTLFIKLSLLSVRSHISVWLNCAAWPPQGRLAPSNRHGRHLAGMQESNYIQLCSHAELRILDG
jgi:hypothetical protein